MIQQEAARVAGLLTKAQRACLIAMTGRGQRAKDIPANPSTLHALWDFRRDYSTSETATAEPVMLVSRELTEFPLGYEWYLTDLGEAVRQHLLQERGK